MILFTQKVGITDMALDQLAATYATDTLVVR